jgi:predicted alpha/beta-hydrolase family hydrolase
VTEANRAASRRTTGPGRRQAARDGERRAEPAAAASAAIEVDLAGHPGLLIRPPAARALYVLAHGAGAGMRHAFLAAIAEALATREVATLRWEFPYMAAGKSRPDRAEVAETAVREVWTAARSQLPDLAAFAGGKSFGGRMTSRAHAAAPLPGLRGLIFLGFPLHPPDKPGVERAEHLATASGPLLLIQGDRDDFAPLRRLRPVVARLGARATLHIVKAADHGFDVQVRSGRTRSEVLDEIADTVASWITVHAACG